MELIHVKLNNGEDLLGYGKLSEDKKTVEIQQPISVKVDPSLGIYAIKWLHFSETNRATIPTYKIMSIDKASQTGINCYEDFIYRHSDNEMSSDELSESVKELEEMFTTMIEAKSSTKH